MENQGYVATGLSGTEIKDTMLRDRAKTIFEIINQCHIVLDDLIRPEIPPQNNENKSIPTGHIPELQEQLRAIELFAAELNRRLIKLSEKI